MRRHLIPRFEGGHWRGDALTFDPSGGRELPPGITRSMRQALGQPTKMRERDEVRGFTFCIQWLGLMIEIGAGRVR